MRRLALAVAALCATLLAPARPARAQTSPTVHVFSTVDAVTVDAAGWLVVTGILQGESAASTHDVATYGGTADTPGWMALISGCERKALLAMAKPGQYLLRIEQEGTWSYFACTLTRAAP